MEKTIVAIIKEPGQEAIVTTLKNTLKTFQVAVGGNIEAISFIAGSILLVDEEGKLKNRPLNFRYQYDNIVGTAVLINHTADGDFCSLSIPQIMAAHKFFHQGRV